MRALALLGAYRRRYGLKALLAEVLLAPLLLLAAPLVAIAAEIAGMLVR